MMPLYEKILNYLTEEKSQPIPKSVNVISPENILLKKELKWNLYLNASTGYIYIGKILK